MSDFKVMIEDSAFLDLLLPALECSLAPVNQSISKEGMEVAGVLWGYVAREEEIISIRKATVLRLGDHAEGWVDIPSDSIDIMRQVARTHWPHLSYLGKFHTHPYINLSEGEVARDGLYLHSEADKTIFRDDTDSYIDLVISLCRSNKKLIHADYVEKNGKTDFSAIIARFSDISVIVKSYRKTQANYISSNLSVVCPAVLGTSMSIGGFGRNLLKK